MTFRVEIKVEAPPSSDKTNYRSVVFLTSMESDLSMNEVQKAVIVMVQSLTKDNK